MNSEGLGTGPSSATDHPRAPFPGGSARVALGILSSRIFGLVREAAFAAYFGLGAHADVLTAVFRGPNVLQNLLGEQSLSASFIPVYSRMLAQGREEEAGRFAGAIFGLMLAAAAAMGLVGVLFAPQIVSLLAVGFLNDAARLAAGEVEVDRFALAVTAIRFTFPMAAVLVLSAWTLGILNSHRRFFLSYFAPVVWNVTIIATLAGLATALGPGEAAGWPRRDRLLVGVCVGALLGALLQFLVQLPLVAKLLRGFRLSFSTRVTGVREALRAFTPLVAARGALQLSIYVDQLLASLLAAGAMGGIRWASLLYILPVSLFALSVAAAELPEMASRGGEDRQGLGRRAEAALRQIGFLVVPTAFGYLVFGFLIVGAIFRWGRFTPADNWLVYLILVAYSLGLPAAAWSRMMVNIFYSLGQTARPARIAVARMTVAASLGAALMLALDRYPLGDLVPAARGGRPLFLGACGLALATSVASWLELGLLRRALGELVPELRLPVRAVTAMAARAVGAAIPVTVLIPVTVSLPLPVRAAAVVLGYAGLYTLLSRRAAAEEIEAWSGRFFRGRRR